MEGILDVSMHGIGNGKFVASFPGQGEITITAEQFGIYLKNNFSNISGIRLFTCYGEESGAAIIHSVTGLPVLSSSGGAIIVNEITGAMRMSEGTLKLFGGH